MITTFRESETRDNGVIYKSTFEQIKKLYLQDKEKGGELAISAIELVLTGNISSNDFMIDLLLEDMKVISERNSIKYEKRKEANRQAKIEKDKLKEIAEMVAKGYTQEQIAAAIGVTQSTISRRITTIRTDYPELCKIFELCNLCNDDNVNDNDNDNDNVDVDGNEFFPAEAGKNRLGSATERLNF